MSEDKKELEKEQKNQDISIKDSKNSSSEDNQVGSKKTEKKIALENVKDDSNKSVKNTDKLPPRNSIEKSKPSKTSNEKNESEVKKVEKLSVKPQVAKDLKDKNIKRKDSENNKLFENQNKSFEQNDLVEKLVSINRVAKVVKGGRRFSFAALVVVGDGNGMVGHGKGKAKEVPEAIKKATEEAKNRMMRVPLRQGRTLHHDIKGRYDAGKVYLRSAPSGTGVIAGGPMRAVFEALGIQDIVAKSVGTSNPHNMVRATFEALKSASSPKIIAMRRGLKINDITKRRKINQQGLEDDKN